LEKWVSEQEKVIAELKDSLQEIKELLESPRNAKEVLKSDNSINRGRRGEREERSDNLEEEEEEEVQRHWMKKVELPTFEGNDPMGWTTRAEIFLEI